MTRLGEIGVAAELRARACAGDEAARAEIYAALAPATFGLIRRLIGRRAAAEDVFQETMMTCFERLAEFRAEAPLGAWLARGRSADFPGPRIAGLERLLPPMLMAGPLGDMELVTLTPQLGRYFGSDKGVLVVRAPAGLKLEGGDVILSIDGRQPLSGSHATRILASYQPGEKLTMSVMRMHKTLEVQTTVPHGEGALRLPAPPVPPPPDGPVSGSSAGTAGARGGHSPAGV